MAHAHAELTGELGVAMVTAGPGVTNTITGRQRLARPAPVGHWRLHIASAGEYGPPAGHSPCRYFAACDPTIAHASGRRPARPHDVFQGRRISTSRGTLQGPSARLAGPDER